MASGPEVAQACYTTSIVLGGGAMSVLFIRISPERNVLRTGSCTGLLYNKHCFGRVCDGAMSVIFIRISPDRNVLGPDVARGR